MNYFYLQKSFHCKTRRSLKIDEFIHKTVLYENPADVLETKINFINNTSQIFSKTNTSIISTQNSSKSFDKCPITLEKLYRKYQKFSSNILEELCTILEERIYIFRHPIKIHYLTFENLVKFSHNFETLKSFNNRSKLITVDVAKNQTSIINKKPEIFKEKITSNNVFTSESKINAPTIQFVLSSPKFTNWINDVNLNLTTSTIDWVISKLRSSLKHIETSSTYEKQKLWNHKPQCHFYEETEKESINSKSNKEVLNLNDFLKHSINTLQLNQSTYVDGSLKLKYTLSNDGTKCLYYPDGKLAILCIQSLFNNVVLVYDMNEKNELIALFSNQSMGLIFWPDNQYMRICIDQNSCKIFNFKCQLERNMRWPININNKLPHSITLDFNPFVSFYCSGKGTIYLKFESHEKEKPIIITIHDWIFTTPVISSDNNVLFCNMSYTSNTALEIMKKNSKQIKKEDSFKTNISEMKFVEDLQFFSDKIRETLENWIVYYKNKVLHQELYSIRKTKSASCNQSRTRNEMKKHISAPINRLNSICIENTIISNEKKHFISERPKTVHAKSDSLSMTVCPLIVKAKFLNRNNGDCLLESYDTDQCLCNKHNVTILTDIELFEYIHSFKYDQVIVIGIISTGSFTERENSKDKFVENSLLNLIKNTYSDDLKDSCQKPCITYNKKLYRLFLYNISDSGKYLNSTKSLLLQSHQISPGMCLMFQKGKLMFADYIFNGYTSTRNDLLKQINLCKIWFKNGFFLPKDFQLSFNNESKHWLTENAYSKIQTFDYMKNVI